MTNLSSSRSGLNSFIFWMIFLLLSCFVTYFLNSMIALANSEKQDYITTTNTNTSALRQQIRQHHKESATEIISAQQDALDTPIIQN